MVLLSSAIRGRRVILIASLIFVSVLFWSEQHHACFIVHFCNANVQESKCEEGHPGLQSASAGLPWQALHYQVLQDAHRGDRKDHHEQVDSLCRLIYGLF